MSQNKVFLDRNTCIQCEPSYFSFFDRIGMLKIKESNTEVKVFSPTVVLEIKILLITRAVYEH